MDPDLPTYPYMPVLVQKLAGSAEVRPYFSKYGHRIFRKYGNGDVSNVSLLPVKPIVVHWWRVIVRWYLHISSHFRGLRRDPTGWKWSRCLQKHVLCLLHFLSLHCWYYQHLYDFCMTDAYKHQNKIIFQDRGCPFVLLLMKAIWFLHTFGP